MARRKKRKSVEELEEEIQLLKIQLEAKNREIEELRREVEELHNSISYRVGRWIAETWWGAKLKKWIRKIYFRQ